jgi:bifunctional DNA-binding transcriptional regulator/antitoxin component of YhaV-PrlF toxin-antitoxin module
MASKTTVQPKERIGRIGQRRQVVIPREILENLQMRTGDLVAFSQQGNSLLVKPAQPVDPDDVLTPDEAKKVRLGMKQIKEGRFKAWRDVRDELGR